MWAAYRGAAAICGTTHKTVRRIIEAHEAASNGAVPATRECGRATTTQVADLVAQKVKTTSGRISAKRLLPAARAAGYAGRTATSDAWSPTRSRPGARGRHRPGAVGRRSGRPVRCWSSTGDRSWPGGGCTCSAAVLAWSRLRFVRFAADEQQATTLGMLAECFEVLGGVPKMVLADRMGCLKGGVVANVVVPTPDYVRFATHYRFRPDFCHAADPESKGIVENLVGYAKDDLLVPLELEQDPWAERTGRAQRARCGVVRGGQRRMHSEILRGPGRATRHRTGSCSGSCRRCAWRSARSRSPARSTSCPASGSDRPATRCRTG